jgi:hypothetical protein
MYHAQQIVGQFAKSVHSRFIVGIFRWHGCRAGEGWRWLILFSGCTGIPILAQCFQRASG